MLRIIENPLLVVPDGGHRFTANRRLIKNPRRRIGCGSDKIHLQKVPTFKPDPDVIISKEFGFVVAHPATAARLRDIMFGISETPDHPDRDLLDLISPEPPPPAFSSLRWIMPTSPSLKNPMSVFFGRAVGRSV